jgi:alkylated DNA repair dioxygenase AlkB
MSRLVSLFQENPSDNLLPQQGEVFFHANLFAPTKSDELFQLLKATIQWKQEPIKIWGKEVLQPRLTAWYGDEGKHYAYSGITMKPLPWTAELLLIKKLAEEKSETMFNSALLNLYRDGKDSMGWHRDNEKELGVNPVIASVSFGAARQFKLRHYYNKSLSRSIELTHGSFLVMKGETQHYWEHQVAKTAKPVNLRINITFRKII